jgi:outer membrane protein assembly factor BamE (lipoprotein component of BamABCDE complex)
MNNTIHAAKAGTAVILAITLCACATKQGRDFDSAYARQIAPGQTTKADVRNKLGRPALVSRAGVEDVWIYGYYEGGGMSAAMKSWFGQADPNNPLGAQQKRLVVTFTGDSVKEATFKQELPPPDPLEEAYR